MASTNKLWNNIQVEIPKLYVTKFPPVELEVEKAFDRRMFGSADMNEVERVMRRELAIQLAEKMIEEDLLITEVDHSIDKDVIGIRAKVKLVQPEG